MNEIATASRPGRPKSEQKAVAILVAAGELFLTQGFQGTAMDAVAQRARVSKQTVYSHFANKEELFQAVIRAKVAGYGFADTASVAHGDLRVALRTLLQRFVELLFDPEVVAMHRVVMGEAVSQPRIAALFYEAGPLRTKHAVGAFLRSEVARGRLAIGEDRVFYAAVQVLNMAVGLYQLELWMGLRDRVDAAELDAHLGLVVEDFLRLYGVEAKRG